MQITSLALSLIDLEDKTFLVGNKENLLPILSSIKEVGLLNPPILRRNGERYQIISGWKRIFSCRELGFSEILCKTYDSSELTDNDCLKIIFYENKNNFSELEIAELIVLFKELGSIIDKELIHEILPLLEIPSNRKNLDKYLGFASLDKVIKDAYYEDRVTIEQCQMLSELTPDNQLPMLNCLLLRYKLNNNESRQLLQIIEELSLRDSITVDKVISMAEKLVEREKKDKNELRHELRRIRYPDLVKLEEKYKAAVKELNFPKQIALLVNQFFEGNDIEFRMKIRSPEELVLALSHLEDSLDKGAIHNLFQLIKKGHE